MIVWQFVTQNMESIVFYTSVVVAFLGFLALACVLFFWGLVVPFYREFWAKLGVAFFRFAAAVSTFGSKSLTAPPGTPLYEQPWFLTTLIALIGYLMWEFAGVTGDHKYKATMEKTKAEYDEEIKELTQDRDDATLQHLRLVRVVTHLRTLANEKLQRVKRAIQESTTKRGSLPETRKALAPNEQITVILETLAMLLRAEVSSTGGSTTRISASDSSQTFSFQKKEIGLYLVRPTVFTAVACPFSDESPHSGLHYSP